MKRCILLFLSLVFTTSSAQAFSLTEARACVQTGVAQVSQTGDLQTFINERISVDSLAAQSAWRAWAIRWNDLSDSQKTAARGAVYSLLSNPSTLDSIKRDTISLDRPSTDRTIGAAVEISGSFRTTGGGKEIFTVRVVDGCYVIDASWQNVFMSSKVASALR